MVRIFDFVVIVCLFVCQMICQLGHQWLSHKMNLLHYTQCRRYYKLVHIVYSNSSSNPLCIPVQWSCGERQLQKRSYIPLEGEEMRSGCEQICFSKDKQIFCICSCTFVLVSSLSSCEIFWAWIFFIVPLQLLPPHLTIKTQGSSNGLNYGLIIHRWTLQLLNSPHSFHAGSLKGFQMLEFHQLES